VTLKMTHNIYLIGCLQLLETIFDYVPSLTALIASVLYAYAMFPTFAAVSNDSWASSPASLPYFPSTTLVVAP